MDRRRVAASTESWLTVDSGWTSGYELEEIHGVMDGVNDHGDHATQDDAHNASEQHHQSPSPSDSVRYRASHAGRHRLTTTTPVVSPRASPPASQRRVSGGQVPTTVHMSRISARQEYLVKLCRAIIMFGTLTHQLEEYMSMSSLPLEIEGEFSYIPGCMTIGFSHGVVELVRASERIDLGRAQDVHDINMDVAHGRLGVEEAARRLDGVSGARSKYKVWFLILMYGLASACVAPFGFGGRLIDLPIAFILGCTVGVLQLVFATKSERYAYVFEFLPAAITSFMARGFGSINNGQLFCFSALAQSSIVMCLPGYVILCGSFELHGRKNAASTRMVYVAAYILRLGCGIPIGAALYGMMDSNATSETHCINPPLSRGWCVLFVAGFTQMEADPRNDGRGCSRLLCYQLQHGIPNQPSLALCPDPPHARRAHRGHYRKPLLTVERTRPTSRARLCRQSLLETQSPAKALALLRKASFRSRCMALTLPLRPRSQYRTTPFHL